MYQVICFSHLHHEHAQTAEGYDGPFCQKTYSPPTGLKMINLSMHILTTAEEEILSLGLTFCPTQELDHFEISKGLHLFTNYKFLFCEERKKKKDDRLLREQWKDFKVRDFGALRDLTDLLDETEVYKANTQQSLPLNEPLNQTPPTTTKRHPKLNKSDKCPSLQTNPNISAFVTR